MTGMPNQEPLIRGHVLAQTTRFFRTTYDYSTAARVEGELSPELKVALDALSPAQWYPRRYQVELLGAIASVRGNSDGTYGDFMRCGAALAVADNEFTRLLIKLLTPELFLKKLPRFWQRDHRNGGHFEVEPFDGTSLRGGRLKLRGVPHYDHAAIVWLGFMQSMLSQLGPSALVIKQDGWSWSNPGPQDIAYDVRWA